MGRFFRQISVVVIEIPNAASIGKGRPIRRRPVCCPDDGRPVCRREFRGDLTGDYTRLLIPSPKCATDRIDHAALYLTDNLPRKVLELKRTGKIGELMSERRGHGKRWDSNLPMNSARATKSLVILSEAQRSRRIPRQRPGFFNGIPRLRSE